MSGERVYIGRDDGSPSRVPAVVAGQIAWTALVATMLTAGAFSQLGSGGFAAAVVLAALAAGAAWWGIRLGRDFSPYRAWLDGSVLTVSQGHLARHSDLASAAVIGLRRTAPVSRSGSLPVLYACDRPGDPPVRLVLGTSDRALAGLVIPSAHLRLLAQLLDARPGPPDQRISDVVRWLRALADRQDHPPGITVDWSHRTDPQGTSQQRASAAHGGPAALPVDWSHRTGPDGLGRAPGGDQQ